jgi:hypothetical protein
MLKTPQEWLLPREQKNLKEVLANLYHIHIEYNNDPNPNPPLDMHPGGLTAAELQNLHALKDVEIEFLIGKLTKNQDIKEIKSPNFKAPYYQITKSGINSHKIDRYSNEGEEILTKRLQFWLPQIVAIVAIIVPFFLYFLGQADTKSLESKVNKQQAKIDSLIKVLEPRPLLRPTPPYRK